MNQDNSTLVLDDGTVLDESVAICRYLEGRATASLRSIDSRDEV